MSDILTSTLAATSIPAVLLAFVAGAAIGTVFFGGLYWTARRAATATQPALWFLGSLTLRMGFALAGIYLVAGDNWIRMLACVFGFIAARTALLRLTERSAPEATRVIPGTRHAP